MSYNSNSILSNSTWGNITGEITGTYDRNVTCDIDWLYEQLYKALLVNESNPSKKELYKVALSLNNNNYRLTVLEIELEKSKSVNTLD